MWICPLEAVCWITSPLKPFVVDALERLADVLKLPSSASVAHLHERKHSISKMRINVANHQIGSSLRESHRFHTVSDVGPDGQSYCRRPGIGTSWKRR